jgi:apolipoprotein N-acyltransferase
MPPFGAWAALLIGLPLMIMVLEAARANAHAKPGLKVAFRLGWCFGFGYHLFGLWWIGSAFLVQADEYAWLLPFAVVLLPAGLAVFSGLGFAIAAWLWRPGIGAVLAFSVGMTIAEYARGHLLTGFPWNLFGYAATQDIMIAQTASVIGVYGLTFLTLLCLSAPALFVLPRTGRSVRIAGPVPAVVLVLGAYGYGHWRHPGAPVGSMDGVRLRIVQPNLAQDERFSIEGRDWILERYLEMSTHWGRGADWRPTHVLWPESAFPFFLNEDGPALQAIADRLPAGAALITGAAHRQHGVGREPTRYYNSVYVFDDAGRMRQSYDKAHLVPFGEYLPLQSLFDWLGLEALTRVRGGYTAGIGRETVFIPGAPPAGILICYEIIFPGAVTAAGERPSWLINPTNDAWFGRTPGPSQHAHQAAVRAIEEGLPVVRVANSGISFVADPYGRIMDSLPLDHQGVLDATLPRPLPPTIYARTGDVPLLFVLLLAAFALRGRRNRLLA